MMLKPITRLERFYMKIIRNLAGEESETMIPITREETFLNEIANGTSGIGEDIDELTQKIDSLVITGGAFSVSHDGAGNVEIGFTPSN